MPTEKDLKKLMQLRSNYQRLAHTPEVSDLTLGENPLFKNDKFLSDNVRLIDDEEYYKALQIPERQPNESEPVYQLRLQNAYNAQNLDNALGDVVESSKQRINAELKEKFIKLTGTTYYAEILLNSLTLRDNYENRNQLNKSFANFQSQLVNRYGRNLTISLIKNFLVEYLNPYSGFMRAQNVLQQQPPAVVGTPNRQQKSLSSKPKRITTKALIEENKRRRGRPPGTTKVSIEAKKAQKIEAKKAQELLAVNNDDDDDS